LRTLILIAPSLARFQQNIIHNKGSPCNNFYARIAISHYFEEKIAKKRSSAQIRNLLLYLKVEAWIVQSSAIESAGLSGN